MGYNYSVIGAGRQGGAIAYDLAQHGDAESVVVLDLEERRAQEVVQRINLLTNRAVATHRLCDATNTEQLKQAIKGSDAVVSALPYFYNFTAAKAAVENHAHFCDLGGNTEIVMQELELNLDARDAEISILPDCGLAPGLSNLLAARALSQFNRTESVQVRCGGLPQIPRPPLGYKLVFSLEGLINEYSGKAIALRDGEIREIPTLSELEEVDVPTIGRLEAATTSGGTSTAPFSFQGKVKNFDYKTLRYPGHFAAMNAYAALGLFRNEKITVGDRTIVPRRLLIDLLRPLIDYPADRDLVILIVDADGEVDGKAHHYRATLIDRGDPQGHFSAMERTTGFPTAAISYLQASGKIEPGATPIEKAVPLELFLAELARRGLKIEEHFYSD